MSKKLKEEKLQKIVEKLSKLSPKEIATIFELLEALARYAEDPSNSTLNKVFAKLYLVKDTIAKRKPPAEPRRKTENK